MGDMTIDFRQAFIDSWALFRRDRDVILAVAGLFLFLPTLGVLLLVPAAPPMVPSTATQAEMQAWADQFAAWLASQGPWLLLVQLVGTFGSLMIVIFYLDARTADVAAAITRSAALFVRFLLVMILIYLPVAIGFALFIVPGLYLLGRLMLAVPIVVAEPERSVTACIGRSWQFSEGNVIGLTGIACLGMVGGQFVAAPFVAIDVAMREAGVANPVMVALVGAAAAAGVTAVTTAWLLVRVTIYRQLAGIAG